jgi:pyruvate,water dikinase
VRGRARVVRSPEHHLNIKGEILVAPMTDPGWVFLMVPAGGLIVERGSILSHTAIIGRELGIPTVVGVQNATSLIADGQMVEIDGAAGTIRLLS